MEKQPNVIEAAENLICHEVKEALTVFEKNYGKFNVRVKIENEGGDTLPKVQITLSKRCKYFPENEHSAEADISQQVWRDKLYVKPHVTNLIGEIQQKQDRIFLEVKSVYELLLKLEDRNRDRLNS